MEDQVSLGNFTGICGLASSVRKENGGQAFFCAGVTIARIDLPITCTVRAGSGRADTLLQALRHSAGPLWNGDVTRPLAEIRYRVMLRQTMRGGFQRWKQKLARLVTKKDS